MRRSKTAGAEQADTRAGYAPATCPVCGAEVEGKEPE